jgi:hypothetical protein
MISRVGAKGAIFDCQNKKFTEKISEASGLKMHIMRLKWSQK